MRILRWHRIRPGLYSSKLGMLRSDGNSWFFDARVAPKGTHGPYGSLHTVKSQARRLCLGRNLEGRP